jgi:hypothetical protein
MSPAQQKQIMLEAARLDERPASASSQEFIGTCILTAALCLGFGFFFSSNFPFDNHPLAIFPLMELTYGALVPWATAVVVIRTRQGTLTKLDLFFILMPILLIGLSSLFAWINYKQPFILGIGEERRNLSFLLWFLYDPIRRHYRLGFPAVFRALFWCATIYLVLSLLIQVLAVDQLLARKIPDLDTRKLRITSPGPAFALCVLIGLVCLATRGSRSDVVPVAVGLAGLILVAQSRQVTILVLLTALLSLFVLRPFLMLTVGTAGAATLGAVLLALNIDPITPAIEIIAPNIQEFGSDNFEHNPRSATLRITTQAVLENYFIGLGGVSVQHDGGGLQKFYGRHFWLNDVGAFGEVFRIGFFWFILLMAYLYFFINELSKVRNRSYKAAILTIGFFQLVVGVSANFLYNNGGAHAFLFLVITAAASISAHRARSTGGIQAASAGSALQAEAYRSQAARFSSDVSELSRS